MKVAVRTALFWAVVLVSASGRATPELFAPAMQFGAKDCSFCHTSPGSTAVNERGVWLIDERDRRGVHAIDVNWLAEPSAPKDAPELSREERAEDLTGGVAGGLAGGVAEPPKARAFLPALKPSGDDPDKPFDYTTAHGEWPAYGGDLGAGKYSPLGEINHDNVGQLAVAWIWDASEEREHFARYRGNSSRPKTPDSFKGTPLMVGGRLFLRTRHSDVVAIDAVTGDTLWTYDPGTHKGPRPPMFGFTTRGLAYHRDEDGDRLLLLASDGYLIALSPDTGTPITSFGNAGRVDLTKGLRRPLTRRMSAWSYPPALCGDVVVVGNQAHDASHRLGGGKNWNENLPLGDVRGFDARTGEQLWVFKTVPEQGEMGVDTWGDESWRWMGNANAWSMMSCDQTLGHVYLPLSAPTHHFYGGFRPGDNLFANSVVALDARTGERVWHFQTVHHDIWDYDLPAAPVVADVALADGGERRVVAQVTKTGFLFVFDRNTGKPVWPVEERPVPQNALDGEHPAPTQPFPTWPPPFELQGASRDDLNALTPELQKKTLARVASMRLGSLFEPPSEEGTLLVPGVGGGANWGGAAYDGETGMLYVASRRIPTLVKARKVKAGFSYTVRMSFPDVDGLPLLKPPWSSITAYRLDTGDIAWQAPNGTGPKDDHPALKKLDLDDVGDLGNIGEAPGLLVTKNVIFLGQSWPPKLRAIDKANGKTLWEHPIEGAFNGPPPMTYRAGGRQFVVIGTGSPIEPTRLTAFRLP